MWSCNRLPRRLGASPVHRYRRVWQRRVRRRGGRGEQAMAFLISHFARLVRLYCLYIKPRIPLHTRGQRCESLFISQIYAFSSCTHTRYLTSARGASHTRQHSRSQHVRCQSTNGPFRARDVGTHCMHAKLCDRQAPRSYLARSDRGLV